MHHTGPGRPFTESERDAGDRLTLSYVVYDQKKHVYTQSVTIEKSLDNFTAADIQNNLAAVSESKCKEIKQLHDLGCFKRMLKRSATNRIDIRWVLRFKRDTENNVFIKGRLALRGFKDRLLDQETYAGTATRWSQRLISSLAFKQGRRLFSLDVTGAFAKDNSVRPRVSH